MRHRHLSILTCLIALAAVACQPGQQKNQSHRQESQSDPEDWLKVPSDDEWGQYDCNRRSESLDPETEAYSFFDYFSDDPKFEMTIEEFKSHYLLMRYSEVGDLVKVRQIVQSGVKLDYDLKLDEFAPAIAWAARCNRVEVVKYLHEQGANINVTFSYIYPARVYHGNVTPLFWADEFGAKEAAAYLRKAGAKEIKERVKAIPWDFAVKKPAKEK